MQACALAVIVATYWQRAIADAILVQKGFSSLSKPEDSEVETTSTTAKHIYAPQASGDTAICTRACRPNCCQACPSATTATYEGPNMSVVVSFDTCKEGGNLSWVVAQTMSGSFQGFVKNFSPDEPQTFVVPRADYIHLQLHDESFYVEGDPDMCQSGRKGYGQSEYWVDSCSGRCHGQSSACDVFIYIKYFVNATTTTTTTPIETTTTTTSCETTSCEIYNDPHVIGFDSEDEGPASFRALPVLLLTDLGHPAYSGAGDVWLVKTDMVHIQGRYVSSQVFKTGGAVMGAIAIGGPILDGKVLLVEPRNGSVTLDGHAMPVGDSETDVARGRILVKNSDLVYKKLRPFTRLEVHLPMHVDLTINRYSEYINAKITMPKVGMGRIDGQCGNSDRDVEDIVGAQIERHLDESGFLLGESLFEGHTWH